MSALYHYKGPVAKYDKCIMHKWEGYTHASSEAKARSNLASKFKKEHNMIQGTPISLPGKIEVVEERRENDD